MLSVGSAAAAMQAISLCLVLALLGAFAEDMSGSARGDAPHQSQSPLGHPPQLPYRRPPNEIVHIPDPNETVQLFSVTQDIANPSNLLVWCMGWTSTHKTIDLGDCHAQDGQLWSMEPVTAPPTVCSAADLERGSNCTLPNPRASIPALLIRNHANQLFMGVDSNMSITFQRCSATDANLMWHYEVFWWTWTASEFKASGYTGKAQVGSSWNGGQLSFSSGTAKLKPALLDPMCLDYDSLESRYGIWPCKMPNEDNTAFNLALDGGSGTTCCFFWCDCSKILENQEVYIDRARRTDWSSSALDFKPGAAGRWYRHLANVTELFPAGPDEEDLGNDLFGLLIGEGEGALDEVPDEPRGSEEEAHEEVANGETSWNWGLFFTGLLSLLCSAFRLGVLSAGRCQSRGSRRQEDSAALLHHSVC
mmetsp:Transcript_68156/g.171702  ORF Transcript_68156/g.171702 Transcript_68156/m.171702 type:complete len:420 (+) Transcript_68156:45-1304(+)